MSALLARLRQWRQASYESDYHRLDAIAARMLADYRGAVADGASRAQLGEILTGLAGCELAMSHILRAMGWNPEPTPEEPELAESVGLSGLLVQELACAATEGSAYRGVRCRELVTAPVATALRVLALSYDSDPLAPSTAQALSNLGHAVLSVIGGQATEVLMVLRAAHEPQTAHRSDDPVSELSRRVGEVAASTPSVIAARSALDTLDSREKLDALALGAVGVGVVLGSGWVAVPAVGVIALPCAWEALVSASPKRRRALGAGLALSVATPVLGSLWPLGVGAVVLASPSARAVVGAVRDGAASWRAIRVIGRNQVRGGESDD